MTREPLRRLLAFSRPYRGRFSLAVGAMLVYAAASAYVGYLVKPIIDQVLPGTTDVPFSMWAALVIGAYVAKGLGSYFSTYLMTDVGQRVVRDIRNQLFRHILDQSAAFFSRRTTGQLMSRITSDVTQVQQAVSETIGDLIREGLSAVGWIALMFWWDWKLTLVTMTGAPLVLYPLVRLGQRVRRSTRRSQEELEHLSHLTAEAFTGHRIVKAFGAEAHEAQRFGAASHRLYRTNLKVVSTVSILPPIMEFLGGVAIVALLWYGQRRIAAGMTAGAFLAFIFAAFMLYTPVKRLSRVNANLQQALAAATRIFEVLDTHSEVRERPGAKPLAPLARGIEFRDVSFAYDDGAGKTVLKNVSFSAKAGQVIALVGLSGAGKTTLVNLLPRFYDVTGGAILIDGVDIRDVTLASLRRQIGIVTQETVLFDDTVANNIAYGLPGTSQAAIEEAARAAHAHEFIVRDLPNKYETRIGERGQRLSGGQRQRLAIARAILKDSPILILDEATSSLDAQSELLVQDALANLMRNRTAFVIAHRLSTVRRADAIVALERGRVAEIGRHEELLARPAGVYAKLYALQIFGREPQPPAAAVGPHRPS
ncbi:MAG TPA: ABC transporter transmembrane domain-containing protein [Vicinamibacterales bacterium]|nr:ABC transporter transmembrane domain-containing protein [Vicinamibacterales bacterium]